MGLAKIRLYSKLFSQGLIFPFLLSVSVFAVPSTASAISISEFLSGILHNTAETTNAAESSHYSLATLPLLAAAVNLDPNPAKGGGDVTIVGGSALLAETGPSGSMANIADTPPVDQISIYVVRPGDTLSVIASLFNVSVNTILWANDIPRGSSLQTGQTLVILPISGIQHTVVKGETVQSIAKKYGGSAAEIIAYNGLSAGASLSVGDTVLIPDGEIATAPIVPRSTTNNPAHNIGGPAYKGYYARPIAGAIETQGLHGYNGVDLAAAYGTPITAAAAGRVIVARNSGWNGGYGEYVVISHPNGTQTLYAHMSSVVVYVGQSVVQGQVVGYEGATGKATGPHLHFEVRGAKNPFANGY